MDLGLHLSRIKFLLKEELLEKGKKAWDDPKTKGRFTHMLVNKVSTKRHCDDMVTQLITNHGAFPVYFDRFDIKQAPQS